MTKPKLLVTYRTLITENMGFYREVRHCMLLPPVCKIFKEVGLILESSDAESGAGHVLTKSAIRSVET
jgi:hypothetical protein